MTLEYRQSLTEVNTIIKFMGKEYTEKLPNKLVKFIKENMDKSYISDINVNIPINKQNIKKDTKILLSLIYRKYWCDEEKKKELIKEDSYLKNEYEKEILKDYNLNKMLKKQQQDSIEDNNIAIVENKENLFVKIINKIKSIFNVI